VFSFLKKQSARPSSSGASTSDTSTARDDSQHDDGRTEAPATPTSADPDHPLASLAVDSPDVPRAEEPSAPVQAEGDDDGFNIAALVAPPASSPGPGFGPKDQARTDALKPLIVEAISTVYDPEIPVNIYELGLIYDIESDAESRVTVTMTLTSPACPAAQHLPSEVKYKTKAVEGVADAHVEVVWEPPWSKDMMSETAKLGLGIF
jgi:FeS assembly SUF system protein